MGIYRNIFSPRQQTATSPIASSSRRFISAGPPPAPPAPNPAYPFSTHSLYPPSTLTTQTPPPNLLHPRKGWSLITHLNDSLRSTYDPLSLCATLFSRRHLTRLRPGSVLTVISHANPTRTSTTTFSGVLMGMRRRGVDTSFRLRNIVNKVGVEVSFKVCSPMIKEVRVVRRAEGNKGPVRDLRRAKVNYLRERPQMLAAIASALKQQGRK